MTFKQTNAEDNPIDEHGKTKRDYEVEKAQKAAAEKQAKENTERANKGQSAKPEFQPADPANGAPANESTDPNANFNQAAAALDPRNRVTEASRRPPVPGVDKPDGGSSDGPGGRRFGDAPDVPRHPLPNPNNPDSPNNPASTANQDLLAGRSTPPLPVGERTTQETRMDGKSPAQVADEAKRSEAEKAKQHDEREGAKEQGDLAGAQQRDRERADAAEKASREHLQAEQGRDPS